MFLSSQCCHSGGSRISVISNNQLWKLGQYNKTKDYALVMKLITMSALERHKSNANKSQTTCHMNYSAKEGVLPQTDMMWRYHWGYAYNDIRKKLEEKSQDSKVKKKGHETRTQRFIDPDWDVGSEFENKNQRFRARNAVMQALALWLVTSVTRAVNVLRYIISKLIYTCNESSLPFDDYCFLSPKKSNQLVILDAMIKRAHTGIAGMKHRIIKEKL